MPNKIDFQLKELTAEEWEVIKHLFEVTPNYVRIGPKGYLLPKKYVSMASDICNLELRPDDITVASFQRSVNISPYFEHVKEALELRYLPNMLFLFYEDILKDLPATIQRVATFLSKELTPAQVDRLCVHLHIDNFRNNKSVNFEDLREFGLLEKDESFIRKGKVGGWRDYFGEMCSQAERWIADNLRDTDLCFPTME